MELNWLEDFLALTEHRNFSRAAEARNVTQPAFGRRIRALEDWIGTPLVLRSSHGAELNAAGEYLREHAIGVLRDLRQMRRGALRVAGRAGSALTIAATHALSFSFVPGWVRSLPSLEAMFTLNLVSDHMAAGEVDFLLCHARGDVRTPLRADAYRSVVVGTDRLVPVSAPDASGAPRWRSPGSKGAALPFLAYSAPSGLGRILEATLGSGAEARELETVFTSPLSAALQMMARQGVGSLEVVPPAGPTMGSISGVKLRHMTRTKQIQVGAAIGLGMTARAAADGGADFLLVLNAGRLRVMGAPSVAAMLPIRDSNRFTDAFARGEILDRVAIPVFFGAAACDPRTEPGALARHVQSAGYHGIANFPTAIHHDGVFRAALEHAGLGFAREVEMLRRARLLGLATLGYAKTRAEVDALLQAGVDRICLNFGWNAGGIQGVPGGVPLGDAAERARRVFAHVRRTAPATRCFVEGGPIVDPAHMLQVCDASHADGYIGGSTLDRLPLEMAVMQTTSAFKTAPLLRGGPGGGPGRDAGQVAGLVGHSAAARTLAARIARLVATDLPIVIEGEPGAGRTTIARAIHRTSRRSGALTFLDGREDIAARLFSEGRHGLLAAPHDTVVVEHSDALPPSVLARLTDWIERGAFDRFAKPTERLPRARLLLTHPVRAEALARALSAQRLVVPPLRDRMEDLPVLAHAMLRGAGRTALALEPAALRLLMAQPWPGNLRALKEVLLSAAIEAHGGRIGVGLLEPLLGPGTAGAAPDAMDERAWILDALRRHRFRRGETAAFLGVSRKTLYNRMRRLGLDP